MGVGEMRVGEMGLTQATELAFSTPEVKGCSFHIAQALNRRIFTLGLVPIH